MADGSVAAATNWSIIGGVDAAVWNPTNINYSAEAPAGSNVGYIYNAAANTGFSQVLSATFQANSSYTLSVKVGQSSTYAFAGYKVQLLANGVVLTGAQDDNTNPPAANSFVTSTISYTYNAADAALVGQPLEIRLLSKGLVAGGEVDFDEVQLSAVLANPAASAGGPYTVSINGSLSLDGSGSLPSDGQTLISYQWDLDNDGDYDEAITGATPPSITRAVLQSTYGMVVGANTIKLLVTDSSSPTPKTSTATGTVNLTQPIAGQLGVLDLTANGGINPNTGNPWQVGDKYRLAFHTLGTTATTSNNPEFYNDFATTEAWGVAALGGTYWRAMVTVNLDNTTTQALSPKSVVKQNTGTADLTGGADIGGAGEPVYVVNGTTCIARNNADIWDSWSNPFKAVNPTIRVTPPTSSQNVYYSPYLNQYGNQTVTPDNIHGKDVATGCDLAGNHVNALGNTTNIKTINRGNSNPNDPTRVWNRFTDATTTARSLYVISVPLTVVDLTETVVPNLISFVDDRGGADAILSVDSVVYTVTFSEAINASTLTTSDFGNAGSASVTIDSIRGTLSSSSFQVIVTPTSGGTLQLQAIAGAVIKDAVGNALDTTSAIVDDTVITVISDTTAPTLVSIVDNVSGGPVVAFNGLAYTVTFDEGINGSTIDIADFGNGGSAPITINSVSPTGDPAVFTVSVTPTGAGSLTLQIVPGATITDIVGNPLVTTAALPDDTTITVDADPLPTLVSITDNRGGGPVFAGESFTYFVTFDQVLNPGTVEITDFGNGGSPPVTVNAVATTSDPKVFAVHVTPGGAGTMILRIKAGAVITNVNGTALDTTAALADDTTITVNAGSGPARGMITVDNTAFQSAAATTVSVTLDASASDKLVVIVTGESSYPNNFTGDCTGVTYDGVPLTQAVDRSPISGTPVDQTFNDIWYLDGPATATGEIVATLSPLSRGSVTAFALSGTAPGVGQSAISPQASKSVVLSTSFANSIVIASHGMGGDGNSANVTAVDAVAPLIEISATAQTSGSPSPWDGHVTAFALLPSAGTASYSFTGGNLVGSHTIAAEFVAAVSGGGTPYDTWSGGAPFNGDTNGDGVKNGLAFLLGAANPNVSALGLLPTVMQSGGGLVLTFKSLNAASRGGAVLYVEHSSNLGISDPWLGTVVPDTNGGPVNGVTFAVTPGSPNSVTATISSSEAAGGKLFGRLRAENP